MLPPPSARKFLDDLDEDEEDDENEDSSCLGLGEVETEGGDCDALGGGGAQRHLQGTSISRSYSIEPNQSSDDASRNASTDRWIATILAVLAALSMGVLLGTDGYVDGMAYRTHSPSTSPTLGIIHGDTAGAMATPGWLWASSPQTSTSVSGGSLV